MKVSICIATFSHERIVDKTLYLKRVLDSVYDQHPTFDFEVIVVDDGSPKSDTARLCRNYPLRYHRIARRPIFRNPSVARNVAYRMAEGEIIIPQSDDVEHQGNAIKTLVEELQPSNFVIANVYNFSLRGEPAYCYGDWHELTGPRGRAQRPIFFLGALRREDLYAVGGCDEDFKEPGKEDVWFGDCLTKGLGLTPYFSTEIVGHHLDHPRASHSNNSRAVYRRKWGNGIWCASGGPWKERVPAT